MTKKNINTDNIHSRQLQLWLEDTATETQKNLFTKAQACRDRYFGHTFFMYGFLYLSTHCRNDCTFCQYRCSNTRLQRYRKTLETLLEAAQRLIDDGVHLLDLTLGEDPYYVSDEGFPRLLELVQTLKNATNMPLMLSPGVLRAEQLRALADVGADWYACYQENHNRNVFAQLRCQQDFDQRKQARLDAAAAGLLVEDGLLIGVGETTADLIESLLAMKEEPLAQVRAMSYVVGEATTAQPTTQTLKTPHETELSVLAAMRLLMPQRLIPASLDVDGLQGLSTRIDAGANVVTSLVPSGCGLAGVASKDLDIENQRRSVAAVCAELAKQDRRPASQSTFQAWMQQYKIGQQSCL